MIKSLSNITDISVIDQNGSNDILTFSKIEFDDKALGSGGFGSVHNVQSIDGNSKSEFVLKIFTNEDKNQHAYDVIKILHDKLKKRQQKTGLPIYHDNPVLLGLPFLVFKGYENISEKHCVAFLMYNLKKLNYEDYGSDRANLDEYKSLSIPDKLYLAYQLTNTIDFLHQIEFIHADLAEDSLWFNSKHIQLTLIDYDSGYHFDSQDKPTTIGKVGHWLSGKWRNIIGQKKDITNLTTLDRLYEDYWQIACATFEVTFGLMPFFFLHDEEDTTKQEYLSNYQWPNIDHNSPLFNKANLQQYKAIISFIEKLENAGAVELISAFKTVFNKGYKNETKRPTSTEWKNLLLNLNLSLENNPLIKNYSSNKSSINKKDEKVVFSFDVQKYNAIYLNDRLVPINLNSITLPLQDSSKIVLKAINDFEVVDEFIEIKAIKVDPEIIEFKASTELRKDLNAVKLSWKTKNTSFVTITNIDQQKQKSEGTIEVYPKDKTTYHIKAIGYFGEELENSLIIDTIKPEILSFGYEVNLNEGIDNIDLHWETKNSTKVMITPKVGEVVLNGISHVKISDKTEFILIAEGLFGKKEKMIEAHPFPIPIVKQIFVDTPKIELNTEINYAKTELNNEDISLSNIEFNNNIFFNYDYTEPILLKNEMNTPEFTNKNALFEKFESDKFTFSDIYQLILKKIYTKLNYDKSN